MELVVSPDGVVRCVYGEAIDLRALGRPRIRRASAVEPDAAGAWWADLSPVGGPRLGPFDRRGDALAAEAAWLNDRYLAGPRRFPLKEGAFDEGTDGPDRDLDPVGDGRLPRPAVRAEAPPGGPHDCGDDENERRPHA
jgi:hypothetical protein